VTPTRRYAIEMSIEVGPNGPKIDFVRIRSTHNDMVSLSTMLVAPPEAKPKRARKKGKR